MSDCIPIEEWIEQRARSLIIGAEILYGITLEVRIGWRGTAIETSGEGVPIDNPIQICYTKDASS